MGIELASRGRFPSADWTAPSWFRVPIQPLWLLSASTVRHARVDRSEELPCPFGDIESLLFRQFNGNRLVNRVPGQVAAK